MSILFGRKERIVCPRCLIAVRADARKTSDESCPDCGVVIPRTYIRDYRRCLPVYSQLFGFQQVGKTMFLDVLRLHLYNMDRVWPQYELQPLTQLDLDHQRVLLTERQSGEPPGSTRKKERGQNEVYLMQLIQMQRWQSRTLVMIDHAGELFERMDTFPIEELPFLRHTPTAFMLISLPDMIGSGVRMNNLLTIYVTALERHGVNFDRERRRLVIVFTKGDCIADLPDNINEYLISDTMWSVLQTPRRADNLLDGLALAEYLERMDRVSSAIGTWVSDKVEGGKQFVNFLERKHIDARFSVISATGQEVPLDGTRFELAPRRVLDPFFWALEFQSR